MLPFSPQTLEVTGLDFQNTIKTTLILWKYMANSLRSLMYLETLTAACLVEIVTGEVYVILKPQLKLDNVNTLVAYLALR